MGKLQIMILSSVFFVLMTISMSVPQKAWSQTNTKRQKCLSSCEKNYVSCEKQAILKYNPGIQEAKNNIQTYCKETKNKGMMKACDKWKKELAKRESNKSFAFDKCNRTRETCTARCPR
jgi:hypothetical protein